MKKSDVKILCGGFFLNDFLKSQKIKRKDYKKWRLFELRVIESECIDGVKVNFFITNDLEGEYIKKNA